MSTANTHTHTPGSSSESNVLYTYITTIHTTPTSFGPSNEGRSAYKPSLLEHIENIETAREADYMYTCRLLCFTSQPFFTCCTRDTMYLYPVSAYIPFRPYNHGLTVSSRGGAAPRSSFVVPSTLPFRLWTYLCIYRNRFSHPSVCVNHLSPLAALVHACGSCMYVTAKQDDDSQLAFFSWRNKSNAVTHVMT